MAALLPSAVSPHLGAQALPTLVARSGLRLQVSSANTDPTLQAILPGRSLSDHSVEILVPEHVTVRSQGSTDTQRLYLFEPGTEADRPAWHATPTSLSYRRDLTGGLSMLVRATLQDDGVLLHYEFVNRSDRSYSMVYAPTDPRLTGEFHDVRLQRTWVHFPEGFRLLAAETPARLTLPLTQWLPARYHASFTWPVPVPLVRRDPDGITNYDTARPVDQPLLATVSEDGRWVVASFAHTAGNVWSNPELTCQHVDPSPPLPAHGRAVVEVKLLMLRGTLDDVLAHVIAQRPGLR